MSKSKKSGGKKVGPAAKFPIPPTGCPPKGKGKKR